MSTKSNKGGERGLLLEEVLREYFLRAGYFTVRGPKVMADELEVTDVDLWLYSRLSSVSRERINVDAKFRRDAKGQERVLWALGLQKALGLEGCIVATNDKRSGVKDFGRRNGVLVLDGAFLDRLLNARSVGNRLTDEEFIVAVVGDTDDKLLGNWKGRLSDAKGRLLTHLDFDGCNLWLEDVRYFMEQVSTSSRPDSAARACYLTLAYLMFAIDFSTRHLAFEEPTTRLHAVSDGFRFGQGGRKRTEVALRLASQIVSAHQGKAAGNRVQASVLEDLENLQVGSLAEYFSKQDIVKDLFNGARYFEDFAYNKQFVPPTTLENPAKAVIGVLLDSFGHDRARFFNAF